MILLSWGGFPQMGLILREGRRARSPSQGGDERWTGGVGGAVWYRAPSPLLPVSRPLGCQGARGASGGHCRLASSGRSAGPRGRGLTPGTNASQGPSPAPPTPTAGNPQKRPTKQNLWFVAPQLVGQHRRLPLPQGGWGRAVGTQATHPSPRGGLGSRRCPPHSLRHCPPPPVPQAGLGTGCWLLGPPQPHGLCPHRGLHPPPSPPPGLLAASGVLLHLDRCGPVSPRSC